MTGKHAGPIVDAEHDELARLLQRDIQHRLNLSQEELTWLLLRFARHLRDVG